MCFWHQCPLQYGCEFIAVILSGSLLVLRLCSPRRAGKGVPSRKKQMGKASQAHNMTRKRGFRVAAWDRHVGGLGLAFRRGGPALGTGDLHGVKNDLLPLSMAEMPALHCHANVEGSQGKLPLGAAAAGDSQKRMLVTPAGAEVLPKC